MSLNKSKGKSELIKYHKLPKVADLKNLYFDDKKSISEIAKFFGATKGGVRLKLCRAGIKLRSLGAAQDLIANHIVLKNELIELLSGLLLGDGCLISTSRRKSACYSHTDKNISYLEWLAEKLKEFGLQTNGKIYKLKAQKVFSMRTFYYRELLNMREEWYPKGKKKIPEDLILTPEILKHWYIGDGNKSKGPIIGKGQKVLICTFLPNKELKNIIIQMSKIGIETSCHKNSGLYIRSLSRERFFNYMLSDDQEIPDSYKYKFPGG